MTNEKTTGNSLTTEFDPKPDELPRGTVTATDGPERTLNLREEALAELIPKTTARKRAEILEHAFASTARTLERIFDEAMRTGDAENAEVAERSIEAIRKMAVEARRTKKSLVDGNAVERERVTTDDVRRAVEVLRSTGIEWDEEIAERLEKTIE